MKVRLWILFCTALALTAVWSADNALGATVSGRASTVLEWFDDVQEDTAVPVYQYLLLNVKDIAWDGLLFRGYGRLSRDLNDEIDADSRLYYGYLEKKQMLQNLDVRFGRQFIATTAGASMMDGLLLKYRNLGPMTLTLFGGGDVQYHNSYKANDLIVGTEMTGRFLADDLTLGLSYLQKRDDSDLAYELIGLDLDYDYQDAVNLYSEMQLNYLTEGISYFLGGAKYHRDSRWTLRGEYLYSLPVFSSTSIYSVFAVNEYQEALVEYTCRIVPGLNSFARVTWEIYQEYDDAHVIEAGIEKISTRQLSGYLAGVVRHDEDGQNLYGVKGRLAYALTDKVRAGVGANLDVLERRLDDDDDTTSTRLWADVTAALTKAISVQAKIERAQSDLWDEYYRGQLRLNIRF